MRATAIVKGLATYIPYLERMRTRESGGAISACYCYSIWLRHLKLLDTAGAPTDPHVMVEIGPGASLGVGLAAMLCGTRCYTGLDAKKHVSVDRNLAVLDELVRLFRQRADIPGEDSFPAIKPAVSSLTFPHRALNAERLGSSLSDERAAALREAVARPGQPHSAGFQVAYHAPWHPGDVGAGSADIVLGHGALQSIEGQALESCVAAMFRWLKPGGYASLQIAFASYGIGPRWNEHWMYSRSLWRIVRGNCLYFYNRLPCSAYLALLGGHGFEIVDVRRTERSDGITRAELAPAFKQLSDQDLCTSSAYILARKPLPAA